MTIGIKKEITAYHLKMLAVLTMLIDHCAAIFMADIYGFFGIYAVGVYKVLRGIGRIAFPIYCFCIVEGLQHTKSRKKYLLRLLLFALISEIPYDIAFSGSISPRYSNVMFTLLFGLAVLCLWEKTNEIQNANQRILLKALPLGIAVVLAELVFVTDYGAAGVLVIVLLYCLRKTPLVGMACAIIILAIMVGWIELAALLVLIPLSCYKGKQGKKQKWFFYIFYPAHLLLLTLVTFI